jgi:hypothetical protein
VRIFGALLLSAILVGTTGGLIFFGTGVFIVLPIAILTAFLLGYPGYLLLRRLGWLRPWHLAIAGMVITFPSNFLINANWQIAPFIAMLGAAAGFVFWWAGLSTSPTGRQTPRGPGAVV